jgi:F-type H+-transporting ATPase subunit alpha
VALFAGTNGYADQVDIDDMQGWKESLLRYMETSHTDIVKDIAENKRISDKTEEALHEAIKNFNATWQ